MSFTYADAMKLTRAPLLTGVFKAIATSDMLLSRIAFNPIQGSNSWMFNREKAIPAPSFLARDASSVPEGTATFDQVAVPFRHIAHDLDIRNATQGQGVNSKGVQIAKALKGLGRTIGQTLIQGNYADGFTLGPTPASWTGPLIDACVVGPYQDSVMSGPGSFKYTASGTLLQYRAPGDVRYGEAVAVATDGSYTLYSDNPNKYVTVTVDASDPAAANGEVSVTFTSSTDEFDGLLKLCPTAQTVPSTGTNGDDVSFEVMNQLLYEVVKEREDLAFVANAKIVNKIRTLLLSVGGTTPSVPLAGFGEVPTYEGVPILTTDWIPSNEVKNSGTTLSSLFLVSFDREAGFYGAVQSAAMTEGVDIDPFMARIMGIQMYAMGQVEDAPADRTRLEWFGAAGLGSELAVGRASELVTA